MNAKISSHKEKGYLLINTSGAIDDWKSFTLLILEEINHYSDKKIILDHRNLDYPAKLFNLAELVDFYHRDLPVDVRQLNLAIVVETTNCEVAKFWETYCNNRGYLFSAFDSLENAEDWINQKDHQRQIE
jgi:hypothetical protein